MAVQPSAFTRLRLTSWRNFRRVDVELGRRAFVVGPNASGKSNLLDAFRFLRDVAAAGGGLASAVRARGRRGISNLRSHYARQKSSIEIDVEVSAASGKQWRYSLELQGDRKREAFVVSEQVRCNGALILSRPGEDDRSDEALLVQTHLEQISKNQDFRELADFFASVGYLHVIPQLVRSPERGLDDSWRNFGTDFLEQIAQTRAQVRDARLRRIQSALQVALPQLERLELQRDEVTGAPHLRGLFKHWRPNAGWQNEQQFSDGTLRLIGLLWALMDGSAPLLLEEPELSLHPAVVATLPQILHRANRSARGGGRQVILTTHSPDLLQDEGVGAEEVLLLLPTQEGTEVRIAAKDETVAALLSAGEPLRSAVVPRTAPPDVLQLRLFDDI